MTKIGRNEPCPCGSGKKYKYCCRNKKQLNKPIVALDYTHLVFSYYQELIKHKKILNLRDKPVSNHLTT